MELQELGEERVEKVVDSGQKGLVEGSLKFRKLRQGLGAVVAERATCPFSLGHQPAGQHLSGCCLCTLPCLEPPSEVLPLRIPSETPPLLWHPLFPFSTDPSFPGAVTCHPGILYFR